MPASSTSGSIERPTTGARWPTRGPASIASIRETVRRVCGRPARAVRYLERPPNREYIISQRRIPEHRNRLLAAQEKEHKLLLARARDEVLHLLENPPDLRLCRSDTEKRVRLEALAMDRARRALEKQTLSPGSRVRRPGQPPADPPSR